MGGEWRCKTTRTMGGSVDNSAQRVVPHVQSKLSQDLRNLDNTTMKRAMVKFRGARDRGAIAFVEYLGVSQEDTREGPL